MIGKIVEHARFGRGVVSEFGDGRIVIVFDGDEKPRRFSYPAATARFLRFVDPDAARQAQSDLEAADVLKQQELVEMVEANRRREEAIAATRLETMRKKRTDAAKKAAERRKMTLAAKSSDRTR